jgi:VWFA-related protein
MISLPLLRTRVASVSVLIACLATALFAEQPSSPSQPADQKGGGIVFKSSVNRVVLDVVVTDSKGKPVRGLTRQDFSVSEDGKPQEVLSFDVHDLDSSKPLVFKLPPMPANTFVNIPTVAERGPLYVLLLDLVNTELDDQAYARQKLLKFIDDKPKGTRFAVFVLSDGLHLVQGFTSDKDQLHDVLNPSTPRTHVPRLFLAGVNFGAGDPLLTITTLTNIARYLYGLPGRKNLIWYSGSFPVQLFPADDVAGQMPDIRNREIQVLDALARSETAVYPVNVRGVVTYPEGRLTGGMPNGGVGVGDSAGTPGSNNGENAAATTSTPGGPVETALKAAGSGSSLSFDYSTEDEIAKLTGGQAFYSRNNLADVLHQATELGADYYTLTYSPSNKNYNGKLRTIQVQLAKKGYYLAYRRAYYATSPGSPIVPSDLKVPGEPKAGRQVGDSLSAYMEYGAPIARQVLFRAHVEPLAPPALGTPEQMAQLEQQATYFRTRKKGHAPKPLAPIKLRPYLVEYTIIGRQPSLEVAAAVYDDDGRILNSDVEDAISTVPGSSVTVHGETYYRIEQRIEVPVKAVSMRLAVHDRDTNRIGTLEFALPLADGNARASLPAETNTHALADKTE